MKSLLFAAVLTLISSLSLHAQEPAAFHGDMLTYSEGGQTFNFRRSGKKQLMLMPGSYSGFVIIPAGIDTDDGTQDLPAAHQSACPSRRHFLH